MLRCPPSRITLTPSDIASFEQRLAARQSARLNNLKVTNVRLSPGPAHSTRLSVVPAEQNAGRKRAASSSSEATLHNGDNEQSKDGLATNLVCSSPALFSIKTPAYNQQFPKHQSSPRNEVAPMESSTSQKQSPVESSPRRQVDSFYGTDQALTACERILSTHDRPRPLLDGACEVQVHQMLVEFQCALPSTTHGNEVLGDISVVSHPTARPPRSEPRAFSSARARRRHARSQDIRTFRDSEETQDLQYSRLVHRPSHRPNHTAEHRVPVPELILPSANSQQPPNPALDPGAPVFVPRTRFGSATGSCAEGVDHTIFERHWSSVDSTHTSSNLRIRSSSEQNVDISSRGRNHASSETIEATVETTHDGTSTTTQARHRRRSRTADQNTAIPNFSTPNLERYPLMRPPSASHSQRRTSNLLRPGPNNGQSSPHSATLSPPYQQTSPTLANLQAHVHVVHLAPAGTDGAGDHGVRIRTVSPALSTSSLSTPNLLQHPPPISQINNRGSSLPWSRMTSRTSSVDRAPSMVSGASGASGGDPISRQSSKEGLDAAAEFLRMRNSPLDDLTARLSRLSASQQRSVGRSW